MLNLLSGEFYKLRKGKSIYMCCLTSVFFIMFIYAMLVMVDKIQGMEMVNGTMGVTVTEGSAGEAGNVFNEVGILDILQQIFGNGFAPIVIAVFTCIFVLGEYAHGAVKNMVGKGYSRGKIFLAKYLTANIGAMLLMASMAVVTVLVGVVLKGTDEIHGPFFLNLFIYTGIQIVPTIALNGIFIAISEITRSAGAGISISICGILFSSLITQGLDLFFHGSAFHISDYWPLDLMMKCPVQGFEKSSVLWMISVSLVWIAVTFVIGSLHFKKKDV